MVRSRIQSARRASSCGDLVGCVASARLPCALPAVTDMFVLSFVRAASGRTLRHRGHLA
jgi:hypothetical protein